MVALADMFKFSLDHECDLLRTVGGDHVSGALGQRVGYIPGRFLAIGSVGEFVGSLVVLVTVVYLAIQVRQTKQSVQSSSEQLCQKPVQPIPLFPSSILSSRDGLG